MAIYSVPILGSSGSLGIGTTAPTAASLSLGGMINTGATQWGVQAAWTASSGAVNNVIGFDSNPSTQAAAFTVNDVYHFFVRNIVLGAGSAASVQYGLYVNGLSSATTNYAIFTNAGVVSFGDVVLGASYADFAGEVRAKGATIPSSGAGVELQYSGSGGGTGSVLAYDRSAAAYKNLTLAGSTVTLAISGNAAVTVDTSKNVTLAGDLTVSGGNMGIGSALNTVSALFITSTSMTGTSQSGVNSGGTFSSAATGQGYAYTGQVKTAAATFTMNSAIAFHASNASIGSGSTITSQYGLYVEALSGATNNYAIWTNAGTVAFGDRVIFNTDNSFDIGASGVTRPRTGYFRTSIVTPLVTATTLTGALSTAAQTNVTSLGTLTGLTMNGDITPNVSGSHNLGTGLLPFGTIFGTIGFFYNTIEIQGGGPNGHLILDAISTPSSPTNGSVWFDGTNFKARVGGVTKTFTLT